MGKFRLKVVKKNKMNKYTYETKLANIEAKRSEYLLVKRCADFLAALILSIISIPIVFLFGILVKLETRGPMFYKQERVGIMGERIFVTKLRSMYTDAEKASGAVWASKNDSRITKIGKFIRKTRVDELPQIWNVLIGNMSLIGPRPERPELTERFSKEVPGFEKRLTVLPGLSGWAQVRGGYESTPKEKLVDDLYYIDHMSLRMDVEIVFKTFLTVLTGAGAR
ncbi:sugar transferase [Weissella confusa]|uniref:sugar transferase n=1 Tax=Weissella confusa TaxID=1583 RepID=UPI0002F2F503|nr:sugar transferase [Weissella confusa]